MVVVVGPEAVYGLRLRYMEEIYVAYVERGDVCRRDPACAANTQAHIYRACPFRIGLSVGGVFVFFMGSE